MACNLIYAVCIRQRHRCGAEAEALAARWVRANEWRLPSGLGGSGQPAFAGLYSLSNHC
jgi:hypothetical protein